MAAQLDPTPFESDLSLTAKSDPTALGREGNTPSRNS
jgi:hypothetical protein